MAHTEFIHFKNILKISTVSATATAIN